MIHMQFAIHFFNLFLSLYTGLCKFFGYRSLYCWLVVVGIGGSTATFAQETNVAATIEQGIYEIRPRSDTTKTLDVGVSKGNGDNVKQWESSGNPNQRWHITDVGDGYYRVSPLYDTTFCLDAAGTTLESTVRVWTYEGKPNQQWQFYEDSMFYEVAPRSIVEGQGVPPLRMDVVGGRTTNNANVQLYTDNNTTAQRWYLKRVGTLIDDGGGEGPVLATDDPSELESLSFSVYPNPAQSQIGWKRSVGERATLSVVTLQGQLVKSEPVVGTQGTLTTQGLAQGIYFVTIQTADRQYQRRLLIE